MPITRNNGNGGSSIAFIALAIAAWFSHGGSDYRKINSAKALRFNADDTVTVVEFPAENMVTPIDASITTNALKATDVPVSRWYSSGGVDYLRAAENLFMDKAGNWYDSPIDNGDVKLLAPPDIVFDD